VPGFLPGNGSSIGDGTDGRPLDETSPGDALAESMNPHLLLLIGTGQKQKLFGRLLVRIDCKTTSEDIVVTQGLKLVVFGFFYSITFYTASACKHFYTESKYLVSN